MKRHYLQMKSKGIILLTMLLGLFLILGNNAYSQTLNKPEAPLLSLIGDDGAYKKAYYPDGRIHIPPSSGSPREFLIPVWIDNRWRYYPESPKYVPYDITSFNFAIVYDATAIRAVGVQKFGYLDEREGYEPLAKHFNISWYDVKDLSYKEVFVENPNPQNPPFIERNKGRMIRIIGTATSNHLPVTDKGDFKILLYVRFQVVPEVGTGYLAPRTPIYIKNDTIRYNDWNVAKEPPFKRQREYDPDYVSDYPFDANYRFHGLGGIDNLYLNLVEQYVPGSVTVWISDRIPKFDFDINRGTGQFEQLRKIREELYEVTDPITIDSASRNPTFAYRLMGIYNGEPRTRLTDITIESDQEWLQFRTGTPGAPSGSEKNPIRNITRKGYIDFIDNNILGDERDPLDRPTDKDLPVKLQIICQPQRLTLDGRSEKAGVYVGYLTFSSPVAQVSPIRIKVTFIYFRNPIEGGLRGRDFGITLTLKNSRGAIGDSAKVIFGTGYRATDGVDSLFGEFAYGEPLYTNIFNARFFPLNEEIKQIVPFGFGDWAPNDELSRTTVRNGPLYVNGSRDIRSVTDTTQSILYYCRFSTPNDADYPIIIEWDTLDFPPGAQLFLRDSVNGSHFNVNMRQATPLGGGRFSYVIGDPRWKSFIIEYTLPRVIRYVDSEGKPRIKNGWNFLSMPVRPTNTFWKVFYRNAINVPFQFSQNQYQQEEYLRPGVGYFVKYPNEVVDTTFVGTSIFRIQRDILGGGDAVRLYTGWNTIGSLSVPFNISNLELDRFDNNNIPDVTITLARGIYGYVTDKGYVEVSIIEPGLGYWLYANKGGYLKMISTGKFGADNPNREKENILARSSKLTIRDNDQKEGTLYMISDDNIDLGNFTLPPRPPFDLFDVRFANDAYIENNNSTIMMLQGVEYPLTILMENPDADYTFVDAATGEVFGTINKNAGGTVKIDLCKSNAIKVLKSDNFSGFDLTSYPMPVSTFSNIKYNIPVSGDVKIQVFDILGNEVVTLLDGYRSAGEYNDIQFDATKLSAGRYIIKMTQGSESIIRTVSVVK